MVGAFYPSLVSHERDKWVFGTGTRNTDRQEPHGFRFILWHDEYKRQAQRERRRKHGQYRVSETQSAILAPYDHAHQMVEFIPSFDKANPGVTPGQLLMTNPNQQKGVLCSSTLSPPLPPNTKNPRYVPEEGRPAVVAPNKGSGKGPKGAKGSKGTHSTSMGGDDPRDYDQPFLTSVPLRVENTVKLAGATCYRSFLIQSGVSFLSGNDKYGERANFEAYARANVGLSRAIGTTIILSPLDMRGLIGLAQVLATLQTGLGLVVTNALGHVRDVNLLRHDVITESQMEAALHGDSIGEYPVPLSLGWLSQSAAGPQVIRLHLILVEAFGSQPPQAQHPCFPGGAFMGLLWGYARDNQRKPVWDIHPEESSDRWFLLHSRKVGGSRPVYKEPSRQRCMWGLRSWMTGWFLTAPCTTFVSLDGHSAVDRRSRSTIWVSSIGSTMQQFTNRCAVVGGHSPGWEWQWTTQVLRFSADLLYPLQSLRCESWQDGCRACRWGGLLPSRRMWAFNV